jgi:hypothetical protein
MQPPAVTRSRKLSFNMAVSLPRKTHAEFERHVKHLAWFALLASMVLLVPASRAGLTPQLDLLVGLGAAVLVVAIWTVIKAVPPYVEQQQSRAYELAKASHLEGACQTAEAIQDRVANLLSITVGYAEFLVDDEELPSDTRERAQHAVDSALAAARVVSTFKQALGCQGRAAVALPDSEQVPRVSIPMPPRPRARQRQPADWTYDAEQRRISGSDGTSIATLARELDGPTATACGQLMAEAPDLLALVEGTQQLGAKLLADGMLTRERAIDIRQLLDRINDVTARLDRASNGT